MRIQRTRGRDFCRPVGYLELFSAIAICGGSGFLFLILLSSSTGETALHEADRSPLRAATELPHNRQASNIRNDNEASPCPFSVPEGMDPRMAHPDMQTRIEYFRDVAVSLQPTTDKIGAGPNSEHRYHNMYGTFLLPYAVNAPNMKFLEIGLGCNMDYGPGASVGLWKKLFPHAELWEAEYVEECVKKSKERHQLDGINVLVGDQADKNTLDEWIDKSGGNYDVVIDDGGHHNCQISNSFDKLWPQVKPGGLYFIEDMHVGKANHYISQDCDNVVMSERLKDWIEQLIYKTLGFVAKYKHKLPADVNFVHCQAEACVVGKKKGTINEPIQQK